MKLYFLYDDNLNHIDITKKGYGASEFQFYMLCKKLAGLDYDITIFNKSNINGTIDKIIYRDYNDIINNVNIDLSAILIIMRRFDIIEKIINFYPSKNIIIWSHDYIFKKHPWLEKHICDIINNNNIKIIAVSQFHKNNLSKYINNDNIYVIYNILYTDVYTKQSSVIINKNNIVFASAWSKGLNKIIQLFDKLYIKYPEFKLILMKPNYTNIEAPKREYIELLNTVDNKQDYCKIIQSSLCTITSEFPETFGCVFAESYYLNTPVIATHNINGLHEFVEKDHICNLSNYNEFEKLLLSFYENRPSVSLKLDIIDNKGLQNWIDFFNKNYQ